MEKEIKNKALELGFSLAGITAADPVGEIGHLESAIACRRTASMGWLARQPASRCDPRSLLPGAKSVICAAMEYGEGNGNRNIARFARGADYHDVVMDKLRTLWEFIRKNYPNAHAKLCVDTSPIMEKALAARAGLGWIGKHTILVNKDIGSWLVLGEIITDIKFEADGSVPNLCGDCCACIDACPTDAIEVPRELDARRCISYLTIENCGPIPYEVKGFIKDGQYGCDICQEACPFNDKGETI